VTDRPVASLSEQAERVPRLYGDLASWWPVLSDPADYADEAAFIGRLLIEESARPPVTLLELGSGGGNNASHLRSRFTMTLVDASPGMLAVSRVLNPDCEHIEGDMRTVRLGRVFDAVLIHDAIMYMTTERDLERALGTAFVHCRPGGSAAFVPDHTRELYSPGTKHGGHDGAGRAMRYLEWTYDPDPDDSTTVTDFAYILREEDGSVHVEFDRHITGLFPQATWLGLIEAVGFEPGVVRDGYERDVFFGRRPE
jgi:ubiquinone/menaquinone biosynthesis C-methylase UbiE